MWRVHWGASDWKIHVLIASCLHKSGFVAISASRGQCCKRIHIPVSWTNFVTAKMKWKWSSFPQVNKTLAVYDVKFQISNCDIFKPWVELMLPIWFPAHTHKKKHSAHYLLMMDAHILHQPADSEPSGETSTARAGYWCFSLMSHPLGYRAAVNKLLCQPWSCALMSSFPAP